MEKNPHLTYTLCGMDDYLIRFFASAGLRDPLQSITTPARNLQQSTFSDMMSTLLMEFGAQEYESTGWGNAFYGLGASPQSSMTSSIFTLFDRLLNQGFYEQFTPYKNQMEKASRIHINQFDAEKQVGGDGRNANCGPASLAMALHALGLRVGGLGLYSTAGQAVDLARRTMVDSPLGDGVDEIGRRVEAEHGRDTTLEEIAQGARVAGANAVRIPTDEDSIRSVLEMGGKVIVSGTFRNKYPLPWTGDRGGDNQTAPGGATDHFVVVSGFDPLRKQFVINDPARRTPLAVSASTLDSFIQGNPGALAITSPLGF